jgi:hypothetical protein
MTYTSETNDSTTTDNAFPRFPAIPTFTYTGPTGRLTMESALRGCDCNDCTNVRTLTTYGYNDQENDDMTTDNDITTSDNDNDNDTFGPTAEFVAAWSALDWPTATTLENEHNRLMSQLRDQHAAELAELSTIGAEALANVQRTADNYREQYTNISDRLNRSQRELREFQTMVRNTVITAIDDHSICRDGGNGALREWGLDEYQTEWSVDLTITVTVTVTADNSDDASDMASRSVVVRHDGDVNYMGEPDITVDDVNPEDS